MPHTTRAKPVRTKPRLVIPRPGQARNPRRKPIRPRIRRVIVGDHHPVRQDTLIIRVLVETIRCTARSNVSNDSGILRDEGREGVGSGRTGLRFDTYGRAASAVGHVEVVEGDDIRSVLPKADEEVVVECGTLVLGPTASQGGHSTGYFEALGMMTHSDETESLFCSQKWPFKSRDRNRLGDGT